MAEKITNIVKSLLDGMHGISHSETIVGEPAQVGAATVIPVHRLRVGFMAGAVDAGGNTAVAEGKTGARGVGGTAQIDPVAVLAVGPDGRPRLLAVDGDAQGTWQGLLKEAPELFTKLARQLADRVMSPAVPKITQATEQEAATETSKAPALASASAPAGALPEKK
jgi:uncharacterized spore protein YtfJ